MNIYRTRFFRSVSFIVFSIILSLFLASCYWGKSEDKEPTEEQLQLVDLVNQPVTNLNSIRQMLESTSPNFTYGDKKITPLMIAIMNADLECVKILAACSDLSLTDSKKNQAIHYAASQPDFEILACILKYSKEVDVKGYLGKTPIMEAARTGNFPNVKMLIAHGADPEILCDRNRDAVMYAAMAPYGSFQIINYLFEHGAGDETFNDKMETPLILAIDYHNTQTAIQLINRLDQQFTPNNVIPLLNMEYTVFNRYDEMTIIGLIAMHHAILANDLKVMEALIEHKLPLNRSIGNVYKTMRAINIEGFHKLLARNNLMADGKTPLIWAAENNNVPAMRLLIENGADPLVVDHANIEAEEYAETKEAVDYIKEVTEKARKALEEKQNMARFGVPTLPTNTK